MQCVILAAGEGKRMRPLTSRVPKVMLPIANCPMLEHLILESKRAGLSDFLLVVGYGEQEVRTYFGDGSDLGVSIKYASQRRQRGTGDALATVAEFIQEPFLLFNGDMLLRHEDIERFRTWDAPCLGTYAVDHPQEYGIVMIEGECIMGLQEKSANAISTTINAGVYLFDPDIFSQLKNVKPSPRGEIELTDALNPYIQSRELKAFPLTYWRDVGYPWDLLDANAEMLAILESQQGGILEEGVVCKGNVSIGEGSVIKSGTYIEGPCIIGRNCRIGPHAYLRGSTSIGNGCHVGHCTEIKHSILMHQTNAPHFNYIGDSIIGSECNLGAGTKIANLRHDRRPIQVGGINTRRTKFGAILGDQVQCGINCSIQAGSSIGAGSRIAAHAFVQGQFADGSVVR